MSKSHPGTINIRWIRSGIAFNRNQKEMVRSLGLRRLHQVVERPDTPGVRGLVAKVAHLVEIIDSQLPARPVAAPEYQIVTEHAAPAAEASTMEAASLESANNEA